MEIALMFGKIAAEWLMLMLLPGVVTAPLRDAPAKTPRPVLVELFTSEGCSSCPPADGLLMELDRKQPVPGANIVVLSEHVDYWNSLGWRDPYSSHQWSERQDDYGRRFGLDSVYTPQMVIDGAREVNGSDSGAVRAAIERSAGAPPLPMDISSVTRTGGTLQIEFTAGPSGGMAIYAVLADDSDRSSVERGENAGRTLEHVAVARSLTRVADLGPSPVDKKIEIKIPPEAKEHLRLILFAQESKTGHIVAVTAREL